MGTPSRYSLEVPERCLRLIEALWPEAERTYVPGQEGLGALTTTFLLGMATPMITLPIERVQRHLGREDIAYLNERPLDGRVASEVDRVLVKGALGAAPFFSAGHWRFASIPYGGQNLAMGFPCELRDALSQSAAFAAASEMPASQWSSCVRNALAHGGVLYLDANGFHEHGQRAEALAFLSARYPKYSVEEHPKGTPLYGMSDMRKPPEDLRVLRITEQDFLSFLRQWVEWLGASGLICKLAA
jgi:hypothetical protein